MVKPVRPAVKARGARVAKIIEAMRKSDAIDRKKEPKAKRTPRPGRGAAKGAAFEREIAKRMSLWISDGASKDLLWRSAGSGGRSTQRRKQTGKGIEYHASDIAPLHPDAAPFVDAFTLECKNYASLDLHQLFYMPQESTMAKWWAQACRDAASVDRIPLMVCKELRYPPLFVFPVKGLGRLSSILVSLHKQKGSPAPMFIPALDAYVIDLEAILTLKFTVFREAFDHVIKKPVPRATDNRPAPDRQPRRRVPLVDL